VPGTCLALVGPLGAGKTQLAKGVAEGLGVTAVVNSPTFIIVNEHAGRLPLFHVDAYRLTDADEARQAGVFDEREASGVTVIEWADRLDGWLPVDRLQVEIDPDPAGPERRILHWTATGPLHAELARALASEEQR
jgi:tRNA threonylcarbamoyladenosine biosynthesis protein TsaE